MNSAAWTAWLSLLVAFSKSLFSSRCRASRLEEKACRQPGSSLGIIWLNDGVDGNSPLSNRSPGSLTTSGDTVQADLAPGTAPGPNYQQGYITCTRDLENFSRLWLSIGGLSQAISSGGITVGLEWHSNTGDATNGWGASDGAPAINIYLAASNHSDPTQKGTSAYLTDLATASDQDSGPYGVSLGTVAKGTPFYLPTYALATLSATNPNAYFLFEGAARGSRAYLWWHRRRWVGRSRISIRPPQESAEYSGSNG